MSIPFNYRKLKGRIVEKCGTQYEFAREMGMSERTLSLKMQGKQSWKQTDILRAIEVLDLDVSDVQDYFFAVQVQNI